MKIVIGTNVVASAIFFKGRPRKLLELLYEHRIQAITSPEIIAEYREIIQRLQQKYPLPQHVAEEALNLFVAHTDIIHVHRKVDVCRDPDDNKFLACATEARCLYIVSGDKDLLTLNRFEDVEILTIAEFMDRYHESVEL